MPNEQAARSLHEIEQASRRSAVAYGYEKASPHLILWGFIWMAGYSATYFRPQAGAVWPLLVLAGLAGDFWIARCTAAGGSGTRDWRIGAAMLAVFLFFAALFAIMPPRSGLQVAAIIPIFVALCYTMAGFWMRGARFVLLGFALGALSVAGYVWLAHYFLLWMAAAGGGALITGGLWLRRV
ncbi:MAG TPA: hypothetical protein VFQ24_01675 [Terriglobia bacterium]|nr:hypothetical protein [Terriglobia bacterium]